jgi:hypothetical protein
VKNVIAPLAAIVSLLSLATANVALAQRSEVGFPPERSPYVDLQYAQEITLIGGQYHAHRDVAFVGPQSGPLIGVHYEWRAGGPAHIVAEVAHVSSDRRLINPAKLGDAREMGTVSRPLWMGDVDLGMSLTGSKSWHRIVPEVIAGVGAVSDLRTKPDSGGYRFGTRFAFNWGGALRYVPGGRWQIRGDIKNRMYTMAYPASYFAVPANGTPVVKADQAKSFWLNNPAFTLGLSYLF